MNMRVDHNVLREARLLERERRVAEREHAARRGHDEKYPPLTGENLREGTQYKADWFTYVWNVGTVTSTGTVTPTPINIEANTAFEALQLNIFGLLNGGTAPYSDGTMIPVLLYMQDGGTSRYIMSEPVPAPLICGNGKLPFILPTERIFLPKSTINLTVTGLTTDTYNKVYVGLSGRKLFDYQV